MNRPTWDEYYIEVVDAIAKRATCDRGRSGAVIVKDKRILATGYVGSPRGMKHCDVVGHELVRIKQANHEEFDYDVVCNDSNNGVDAVGKGLINIDVFMKPPTLPPRGGKGFFGVGRTSDHCIRTVHAEANAIYNAAYHGVSINGATMYCTMVPCRQICGFAIVQCGIKRVVAKYAYHQMQGTIDLFKEVGIQLDIVNKETSY